MFRVRVVRGVSEEVYLYGSFFSVMSQRVRSLNMTVILLEVAWEVLGGRCCSIWVALCSLFV